MTTKLPKKKIIPVAIPTKDFIQATHAACPKPFGRRATDQNVAASARVQGIYPSAPGPVRYATSDEVYKAMGLDKQVEPKKVLLQKAHETITGPRQADYGDKLQNFSQIAMLFQGTLATKLQPGARITPEDVALLMMQVKIARLAKSPDHKDSTLDVAGYAGCYDMLQEERLEGYVLKGATYDSRS